MKPTEEQVKRFWEWCGLRLEHYQYHHRQIGAEFIGADLGMDTWVDSVGEIVSKCQAPSLDLNNLFKYAVPRLREVGCRAMLSDKTDGKYILYMGRVYGKQTRGFLDALNKDPALALFWAIYQVMEDK